MPFIDEKGDNVQHIMDSICPVAEHLGEDKWQLSGTCFYIYPLGIALTAAHNLFKRGSNVGHLNMIRDSFAKEKHMIAKPAIIRILEGGKNTVKILYSMVTSIAMDPPNDIAILLAGPGDSLPRTLKLTTRIPNIGEKIFCYSYPNKEGSLNNVAGSKIAIEPLDFHGVVSQHFLEGRDLSFLPGPCIEAQMEALGGTSGGPVFDERGNVFGVISSSLTGKPPISYITPIFPILDIRFPVNLDGINTQLCLLDFVQRGLINIIE